MEQVKMSDENVIYCLQTLAGFESSDIDCDDLDIVVNDDNQFTTMSIVEIARLGYELAEKHIELIAKQAEQINMLREALKLGIKAIPIAGESGLQDDARFKMMDALSATEQE